MEACGISSKILLSHKKRAAQIKLLLRDVDGTMTNGGLILLSQTEDAALEIKIFDAHEGQSLQGLTLAHIAGLRLGLHHLTRRLYWPVMTQCLAVT